MTYDLTQWASLTINVVLRDEITRYYGNISKQTDYKLTTTGIMFHV